MDSLYEINEKKIDQFKKAKFYLGSATVITFASMYNPSFAPAATIVTSIGIVGYIGLSFCQDHLINRNLKIIKDNLESKLKNL